MCSPTPGCSYSVSRYGASRPALEVIAGYPPATLQKPWLNDEDLKGWRTVHRGTGQRRQVRSSEVVELSRAQRAWIDRHAKATGLLRHQFIQRLIDEAMAAELATAQGDEGSRTSN